MTRKFKALIECSDSHREHGDLIGARAIAVAARTSKAHALRAYPNAAPAIENAFAYAQQECGE